MIVDSFERHCWYPRILLKNKVPSAILHQFKFYMWKCIKNNNHLDFFIHPLLPSHWDQRLISIRVSYILQYLPQPPQNDDTLHLPTHYCSLAAPLPRMYQSLYLSSSSSNSSGFNSVSQSQTELTNQFTTSYKNCYTIFHLNAMKPQRPPSAFSLQTQISCNWHPKRHERVIYKGAKIMIHWLFEMSTHKPFFITRPSSDRDSLVSAREYNAQAFKPSAWEQRFYDSS